MKLIINSVSPTLLPNKVSKINSEAKMTFFLPHKSLVKYVFIACKYL